MFKSYIKTIKNGIELKYNIKKNIPRRELGKWMKKRFEESGPTYIKIGQFISSRPDLFGKELTDELEKLQDDVEPIKFDVVKEIIKDDKISKYINDITEEPLASASIGQVHLAKLKDGTDIALKIKRPGIDNIIEEDLMVIKSCLTLFKKLNMEGIEETMDIVNQFERTLKEELNFSQEIINIKKFNKMYENNEDIYIPKVYEKVSSKDIIVMEYVPSKKLTDKSLKKKDLANKIMNTFIQQLINEGLLHGDPHGGNLGIQGNKIILYDYGNVVYISKNYRDKVRDLLYYIQLQDISNIIKTMKEIGIKIYNIKFMYSFIEKYLNYLKTVDINQFSINSLEISSLESKIPIKLDNTTLQIFRCFSILEGVCKELDDNFTYSEVLSENMEMLLLDIDYISYRFNKDINKLRSNDQEIIINDEYEKKVNIQRNNVIDILTILNILVLSMQILLK